MNDLERLVTSYWKLSQWINKYQHEKKITGESALNQLKILIDKENIEMIDVTGHPYDPGLAVDVLYSDAKEDVNANHLVITETRKPIILKDGKVISFGQVVIGEKADQVVNKTKDDEVTLPLMTESLEVGREKIRSKKSSNRMKLLLTSIIFLNFFILGFLFYQNNLLDRIILNNKNIQVKIDSTLNEIDELHRDNTDYLKKIEKLQENVGYVIKDENGNQLRLIYYLVRKGDTLKSICRSLGIDYQSSRKIIVAINGIENANFLEINQLLILPKEEE